MGHIDRYQADSVLSTFCMLVRQAYQDELLVMEVYCASPAWKKCPDLGRPHLPCPHASYLVTAGAMNAYSCQKQQ